MGKTGKWFKSFLTGKKEKEKEKEKEKDQKSSNNNNNNGSINQSTSTDNQNPKTQVGVVIPRPTTPKEKKRWSFRRSSATNNATTDVTNAPLPVKKIDVPKFEPPTRAPEMAAPPHEKLVQEVAADIGAVNNETVVVKEVVPFCNFADHESCAVKIQAVFRSYLARKALKALRGLVKLQALVRGHLVRKQATATLRCMQALVTAQARARAQRIRSADEGKITNHRQSTHRRNSLDKIKYSNHDMEENIKIVEMDRGEYRSNVNSRNSYSIPSQQQINDRMDNQMSTYYSSQRAYTKQEYPHYSPAPSAITDMSPRTCSGHFEDYSFATAQSSPQCYSAVSRPDPSRTPFSFPRPEYAETMSYDFPLYPNYMANTESSRAKLRSQSAPKQRPPEFERQPSRGRRPSVEGRNIPKGAKMQRSSSHVGSTAQNYQYPWSIKLDKSTVSLKDSECGSTCSVATNAYYCRSVVSYDPRY